MTGAADGKSESESAIVTAGLLVIGDEILSGRTKDKNIGFIAEYLTAIGIDLKEVRVVPDEQPEIVAALNALRTRYSYVFTTGASAQPMTISPPKRSPRRSAFRLITIRARSRFLRARLAETGGEMNEARMRMTRIPAGGSWYSTKFPPRPVFVSATSSSWPASPASCRRCSNT